jgi:hypothetical protein
MSDEEKLRRRRERQVDIYHLLFQIYLFDFFQAKALEKKIDNSFNSTDTSSMLFIKEKQDLKRDY